jgi:hypothetical protein
MYGGHITDKWDRRANVTYLDVIVTPKLFEPGFELFPRFRAKTDGTWDDYLAYIDAKLPPESPMAFGMHPNAEINFLMSEQVFLSSPPAADCRIRRLREDDDRLVQGGIQLGLFKSLPR